MKTEASTILPLNATMNAELSHHLIPVMIADNQKLDCWPSPNPPTAKYITNLLSRQLHESRLYANTVPSRF